MTKPITDPASTTTRQGRDFEETVAALFRLCGATVVQNILLHGKKVDLLASFSLPGGSAVHRTIVECKDEQRGRAQNQRVMELKGLLTTARAAGTADSAEIVTRVPWGDAAKGFAREAGINLTTYDEKVSGLLDLREYLNSLIRDFSGDENLPCDEPPLASYYVEPILALERANGLDPRPFDRVIGNWLAGHRQQYQIALFGSYGVGKSSFCKKLAHDFAKAWLGTRGASPSRIPILIDLRRFTKTFSIESLIVSFLDERCGVVNPKFKAFEMMNTAGLLLLILDGFDEMAVRVDADTLDMNMAEIEKLCVSEKARLILTGRDEYFVSTEEQRRLLRPIGRKQGPLDSRAVAYLGIQIRLWDDVHISDFLRRRIPLIKDCRYEWTEYLKQIRRIPGMWDLAQRAVLLGMIAKTLPELVDSGKEVNRANLYETYLKRELRRQKVDKRRQMLLSEDLRFKILQDVAVEFHTSREAFTFTDAKEKIRKELGPSNQELESYTRDFLACSFLIRDGSEYVFSHQSIMEYLAARALRDEMETGQPRWFDELVMVPAVETFLLELSPPAERLWGWLGKRVGGHRLAVNVGRLLITMEAMNLGESGGKAHTIWFVFRSEETMAKKLLGVCVDRNILDPSRGTWSPHGGATLVRFSVESSACNDESFIRSLSGLPDIAAVGISEGLAGEHFPMEMAVAGETLFILGRPGRGIAKGSRGFRSR